MNNYNIFIKFNLRPIVGGLLHMQGNDMIMQCILSDATTCPFLSVYTFLAAENPKS